MFVDFLLAKFAEKGDQDAIIWRDTPYSYRHLAGEVHRWNERLEQGGVAPHAVVSLESDFSPAAVACLIALIERGCIVVPLTPSVQSKKPEFREIAGVEWIIQPDGNDAAALSATGREPAHDLLKALKAKKHPGLVLFSSGSTGKSKAALHDFAPLLEKFKVPRHAYRTIGFLLFDHIGGINTLFYTLSNGGCLITLSDRNPSRVCKSIEKHKAEILPTSPTFINLLLLSEAYKECDLGSLEMVTYGTEVMPETTLRRFHELFPGIKLLQTYGLSELGILRSKSRSSDSLWVKIGGEGFETRVRDGLLEIKAASAMLGYLNAPSPFTEDGWFQTGDAVEVDGEYLRILGRKSELINVGGEKVYPAEVESALQLMDGVEDVTVTGEKNPLTGQMVKARVKLSTEEPLSEFVKRMRAFCKGRLAPYKIPQKVVFEDQSMYGERFKKMRRED
jgi:acyl-coenzyme A synthetase/AMP-(fatty) acid ligase